MPVGFVSGLSLLVGGAIAAQVKRSAIGGGDRLLKLQ